MHLVDHPAAHFAQECRLADGFRRMRDLEVDGASPPSGMVLAGRRRITPSRALAL